MLPAGYSRRTAPRVAPQDGVWVYWHSAAGDDISRVKDLSTKGLFIMTPQRRPAGIRVKLEFLVQEGTIRADAEVRHARSGSGLGLKFTAVNESDVRNLAALMQRCSQLP